MAAFQIVIGFCRVQNTPTAGVDNHQFAWPDAAFFDHFVRLVIPDTDFRGAGDELIFGDDVARRTQTVTVEVTGGKTTVGHHDARRAIPRLHMHGVKVKEGTQFRVHIRLFCQAGGTNRRMARMISIPPAKAAVPACYPSNWSQSRFR